MYMHTLLLLLYCTLVFSKQKKNLLLDKCCEMMKVTVFVTCR